jgi:hypothetical protein
MATMRQRLFSALGCIVIVAAVFAALIGAHEPDGGWIVAGSLGAGVAGGWLLTRNAFLSIGSVLLAASTVWLLIQCWVLAGVVFSQTQFNKPSASALAPSIALGMVAGALGLLSIRQGRRRRAVTAPRSRPSER